MKTERTLRITGLFLLMAIFFSLTPASSFAESSASVDVTVRQVFTVYGTDAKPDTGVNYSFNAIGDAPSPTGASEGVYDFKLDGNEKKTIHLSYVHAGVFEYTLSCSGSGGRGYTYDSEKYTIKVFVKNTEDGGLAAEVYADKSDGNKADLERNILAEDINAGMNTDYASAPVEIAIPEQLPDPPVTFDEVIVTFKSNGGSSVQKQTVNKGEKVTEPEEPTKDGYVFNGWFTDKKCKNKYSFDSPVMDDMTLYAGWVANDEASSIVNYPATSDVENDAEQKKDDNQKNKQTANSSTENSFAYKGVEWLDKAAGKAKITISAKDNDVQKEQIKAVYAFTKCTAHGFKKDIAIDNIKFLVKNYGSTDIVVAEGSNKRDCIIIENISTTNEREIAEILDDNDISFIPNTHYNVALYLGICKYLDSHDPYVVYTSFDSKVDDTESQTPSVSDDCWAKLKAYKTAGRYFAMGQDTSNIGQVTYFNMPKAIRAGLADPRVFDGMNNMTTSGIAKCDYGYGQSFSAIGESGNTIVAPAISITDTVDGKFKITKATSNIEGAKISTTGNNVEAGFGNIDQAKVVELYIEVELKDKTNAASIDQWIETNNGDAKVTFDNPDGGTPTVKTVPSPKLYYDSNINPDKVTITTSVVNGTIDPSCDAYKGNNKTINYAPKVGYKLKSITVDGNPVDISQYPNSYTFTNLTGDHNIAVVYSKGTHNLTITKSISDTSYVQPNREFCLLVTIKDANGNAPSQKQYKYETKSSESALPNDPSGGGDLNFDLTDDGSTNAGAPNLSTTTRITIAPNSNSACYRIYGIEDGMNVTIKEIDYDKPFTDSFDKPTIKVGGVEDSNVEEILNQDGIEGYKASTIKLDGDKTVEITNNAKKITPTGVGSAGNILLYIIIGMGMVGAALYLLRRKFN